MLDVKCQETYPGEVSAQHLGEHERADGELAVGLADEVVVEQRHLEDVASQRQRDQVNTSAL